MKNKAVVYYRFSKLNETKNSSQTNVQLEGDSADNQPVDVIEISDDNEDNRNRDETTISTGSSSAKSKHVNLKRIEKRKESNEISIFAGDNDPPEKIISKPTIEEKNIFVSDKVSTNNLIENPNSAPNISGTKPKKRKTLQKHKRRQCGNAKPKSPIIGLREESDTSQLTTQPESNQQNDNKLIECQAKLPTSAKLNGISIFKIISQSGSSTGRKPINLLKPQQLKPPGNGRKQIINKPNPIKSQPGPSKLQGPPKSKVAETGPFEISDLIDFTSDNELETYKPTSTSPKLLKSKQPKLANIQLLSPQPGPSTVPDIQAPSQQNKHGSILEAIMKASLSISQEQKRNTTILIPSRLFESLPGPSVEKPKLPVQEVGQTKRQTGPTNLPKNGRATLGLQDSRAPKPENLQETVTRKASNSQEQTLQKRDIVTPMPPSQPGPSAKPASSEDSKQALPATEVWLIDLNSDDDDK